MKVLRTVPTFRSPDSVDAVLERMSDGYLALASDWTITHINRAAENLLQIRREAVVGQNYWEAFPQVKSTSFETALLKGMKERTSVRIEDYYAPDRAWYDLRVYTHENGIELYFLATTEQRRAEISHE